MPWIYRQHSGRLEHDGHIFEDTDAGASPGHVQTQPDPAAVPPGRYRIGAPRSHARAGSFTLPLTPSVTNHAARRPAYMIHGPSPGHTDDTAHGSLILPLSLRRLIWTSGDRALDIVR